MDALDIRDSEPADRSAIEAIYPLAFPDEDLLPLVRALLDDAGVDRLSLVAAGGSGPIGHVLFTLCGLEGGDRSVALLGPLAVAPSHQRKGAGRALIEAGFRRLEKAGVRHVCVLGDPAYYARYGFRTETRIEPPYPLPVEWREAWQSVVLGEGGQAPPGKLLVPAPWRQPALWLP